NRFRAWPEMNQRTVSALNCGQFYLEIHLARVLRKRPPRRTMKTLIGLVACAALATLSAGCAATDDSASENEDSSGDAILPWRMALGARWDATRSNVSFAVESAHATRIELWVYAQPMNADAALRYAMTSDASGVWSASVPASDFAKAGVDTIYYGYRAW